MTRPSPSEPRRRVAAWPWAAAGLAGLFVIWSGLYIWRNSFVAIDGLRYFSLFDDSLISMRYAWNLAHGNGLVWNPGEAVEGYTSLLMTLLMTLFHLVGEKRLAVLVTQMFGVVVVLVVAVLTVRLQRVLTEDRPGVLPRTLPELLVFGGMLAYYPLVYWSLMGMETGILTALVLASAIFAVRVSQAWRPRDTLWTVLALGSAYLSRPDALVFAVVLTGYLLAAGWAGKRVGIAVPRVISLAVGLGVFVAGQTLFRWLAYGELVPNTYVLKVEGFPLEARLRNGWAFVAPYFVEYAPILILVILGLFLTFSRTRFLALAWWAASVAYQIWIGGDAWRMWRFLAPAYPFLLAFFTADLDRFAYALAARSTPAGALDRLSQAGDPRWGKFLRWIRAHPQTSLVAAGGGLALLSFLVDPLGLSDPGIGAEQRFLLSAGLALGAVGILGAASRIARPRVAVSSILAAVLFVASMLYINARFLPEMGLRTLAFDGQRSQDNINISLAVRDVTHETASVGAFSAGSIPYYTGRYAIDFLGKSDRRIANLEADLSGAVARGSMLTWPGHNKYDLRYSIGELLPTYVQGFRWGRDNLADMRDRLYVTRVYKGVPLALLRDSSDVRWELLEDPK